METTNTTNKGNENMSIIKKRLVRFATPKHITQKMDEYGCVGFTSYGFIDDGSEITHIKNPDYNWGSKSRAGDVWINDNEEIVIVK